MSRRPLIKTLIAGVATSVVAVALLPAIAQAAPPVWWLNASKPVANHVPTILWGELKLSSVAVGEIHCINGIAGTVWNEGTPSKGLGKEEGWGTNACKAPELEQALKEIFGKTVTIFATAELPLEKEERQGETCEEESKTLLSQCPNSSERIDESLIWKVFRRVSSFPWNIELTREEREEQEVIVPKIGIPTETSKTTCYPEESGHSATWENVPAGCVKIDVIAPQIPDEIVFYGTWKPQMLQGSSNGLNPSRLKFNKEAGLLVSSEGEAPETENPRYRPLPRQRRPAADNREVAPRGPAPAGPSPARI